MVLRCLAWGGACAVIAATVTAAAAGAAGVGGVAQPVDEVSPVYIADAPLAQEALSTVGALMARGGADEAVRLVQRVLEEQGDRLIASDAPGVYVPARARVHRAVLENPGLLGAYRLRQTARARVMLEAGDWRAVERSYWMTEPGFEAGLRLAQSLVESARFGAGVRALGELESHPDAGGGLAGVAAALAARAAGYADSDEAWDLASRWAARAGAPAPARAPSDRPGVQAEPMARSLEWSTGGSGPVSLDGVVQRALHTAELTELEPGDEAEERVASGSGAARVESPWSLPTLAGGALFVNDGMTLSCFDRFTLRPRWRVREESPSLEEPNTRHSRARLGRLMEDSASVTVEGPDVFAALGLPRSNAEVSAGRVVCVDRATGRVRWSVLPGGMGAGLEGAEPRGPVLVVGDVVVVGARKNLRSRRLVSLSLVGLDRRTGSLLWSRALGSAGSLPFQQMTHLAEGGVVADGVVYWTDKMGMVAALEAATGRVRWVRATRAPGLYTRGGRTPFSTSLPVFTQQGLFVLSPDQATVLLIDPATGALIGEQPAEPSGEAGYLVAVDGLVACVGTARVAFYDPAGFGAVPPLVTDPLTEGAFRGRAVRAGGRLAAPVEEGIVLVGFSASGDAVVERLELDGTGNIILGQGQAVVVDESLARSFLSWDAASAMLEARVVSGDLEAALALAELAHRSGREGRVLDAIDSAVRLARDADAAAVGRVFDLLRRLADPDAGGGSGSPVGVALRGALLERMGAMASTPEQRLAHAMATGAWKTASGDAPGAAAAYQNLLLEPALSRAIWNGGGLSVRGELEASRRLQELGERFGDRAMAASDEMARREEAAHAGSDDPEAWALVARRYPASGVAPGAWARAAAGRVLAGRLSSAERAARAGMRSARAAARRGLTVAPSTLSELAGALVVSLREQGRADEAPGALAELTAALGPVTPTLHGRPATVGLVDPGRRHAALGPRFTRTDVPVLLAGSPVVAPERPGVADGHDPARVLMHAPQLGEIAMYGSDEGVLTALWRVQGVGAASPALAHADAGMLVLVWPAEIEAGLGAVAEARDAATGEPLWSVPLDDRLGTLRADPDPASREDGRIVSPLDGAVLNAQILAACDGRTLVISDRRGRALALDTGDGRELWRRTLSMSRVYGLDLAGGVLGACGAAVRPTDPEDIEVSLRGVAEALDPRTGETMQILDDLGDETRWVRVAPDGQVIVAARSRVVALDTLDARVDWSNADAELSGAMDAWVLGEQVIVLDPDGALWSLTRREGVRSRAPLDTLGRLNDRGWMDIHRRGSDGGFVVVGARGVTTHDAQGRLLAADALDTNRAFLATTMGEHRAVLVERPIQQDDGETTTRVAVVDTRSGQVEDRVSLVIPPGVGRTPTAAVVADGAVVIGFGEVSVVLTAPGSEG